MEREERRTRGSIPRHHALLLMTSEDPKVMMGCAWMPCGYTTFFVFTLTPFTYNTKSLFYKKWEKVPPYPSHSLPHPSSSFILLIPPHPSSSSLLAPPISN
jgi:hypothetical protein